MACYHPLHAFEVGINPSGKPKYKIESGQTEWIHPITSSGRVITDRKITTYTEIPCGKCVGCRLDYSRMWATRCMLEAQYYKDNQFITLTYSDEFLPVGNYDKTRVIDDEVQRHCTLNANHLKKFMKDLRRYYKYHFNHENIRFFACGEYGDHTERAHYHLIVFNLPVYDKVEFFKNKANEKIYLSETIEKIWGKGIITVGDVTWNSAAYVARYVMKKAKGPGAKEFNERRGTIPEFVRMSRKPGIGRQYFEENKEKIYKYDEIYITNKQGIAQKVKPSKYYDNLYDMENPDAMKALKAKRQMLATEGMLLQLKNTSLSKDEYLAVKERNHLARIETLKRMLE